MANFLINYWYIIFIIAFIFGGIFFSLLRRPFQSLCKEFVSKTPIIRKYWSFVIIFSILLVASYIIVFSYSPVTKLSNYLDITGQIAALVFAIFVGYFAFLQLVENRITTLKQEGFNYFKQRAYTRATKIYEEVFSINTKNFNNLAELLELYLIEKDFPKFEAKLDLLNRSALDKKDKFIIFYLKIAEDLIQEHISEAKTKIAELIVFKKENPRDFLMWDFSDIKMSPPYAGLGEGDAKKLFDNFISYLTNTMQEENRNKFEGGNYTLAVG